MADSRPDGGDTVLDRIESILDVLQSGEPLTLTQVMDQCDLPRATIHRSLQRMVRMRWVTRVGNKYQLGVKLFELGTVAVRSHWFHRIAYPHLADLHRESNAVVHLGFLEGPDVLYWDKVGGALSERVPTRVGDRRPARRTAIGKALLAAMPNSYVESVAGGAALRDELAKVRAVGVSFDLEESVVGLGCIGAAAPAAYHPAGEVTIASISVCAPINRIKTDRNLVVLVRETAGAISRAAASCER